MNCGKNWGHRNRVTGKSGNQNLSPDNYDIKHIATILQNVENYYIQTIGVIDQLSLMIFKKVLSNMAQNSHSNSN